MKYVMGIVVHIAVALAFASCSKDEPFDKDKSIGHAVYKTTDGEYIVTTDIGTMHFTYNENGLPIKVDDWSINYNNMTFTDGSSTGKFSLNDKGYFNSVVLEYTGTTEYDYYKYQFEYDSKGRLTGYTIDGTETYKYQEYVDYISMKATIQWNGEKITKCYHEYKEWGYHGSDSWSGYCYPQYEVSNKLGQYTISYMACIAFFEDFKEIAFVGLIGNPTAYLPCSFEWVYDDGEEYDYEYEYTFGYDGRILTESECGYRVSYKYRTFTPSRFWLEEEDDAVFYDFESKANEAEPRHKHHRHRHR